MTFKVADGSWEDGATGDITVTVFGPEGTDLKLTEDQIPAAGGKPKEGYAAGNWDVTPSTDTASTEATIYTYTYAQKKTAPVTKVPDGLSLNGNTGEITGTPEKKGKFSFTVKASKDGVSTSVAFQIKIAGRDEGDKPEDDVGEEKHKEEDHTPPSWILNPNEKQALGITYTGLAPGTTAGYQEQGEAAEALLAAGIPDGWKKAFSFSLLNGGVPDQTLKCGTLSMFIHPEYQKAGGVILRSFFRLLRRQGILILRNI